jgi:hypothetical protein
VRRVEDQVRRLVTKLGIEPVADPLLALQELAGEQRAWADVTGQMVAELEGEIRYESGAGMEQLRSEVVVYERASERLGSTLAMISRLRIDERLAAIDERRAAVVVRAIEAALVHAGITGPAFDDARQIAAAQLRVLDGELVSP